MCTRGARGHRGAVTSSGIPGEKPTLLSHRPHPCCRPQASSSPDGGLSSGSSLDARPPVKWSQGRRQTTPLGPGRPYFHHQLPPLTPHTWSPPQSCATARQRTCPEDPSLPDLQPPFTLRRRFLVTHLTFLVRFLYILVLLLRGGERSREIHGQQVESLGADPFSWRS